MAIRIRGMLRENYWYSGDPEPQVASLAALCPACGFEHSFNVDLVGHSNWHADSPVWTFNGDYEKPTFRASMLANEGKLQEYHPICHSFVTDGVWQYLDDCTHAMAGQHMPDDSARTRRDLWAAPRLAPVPVDRR